MGYKKRESNVDRGGGIHYDKKRKPPTDGSDDRDLLWDVGPLAHVTRTKLDRFKRPYSMD